MRNKEDCPTIKVEITLIEYNFLRFVREMGFGRLKLEVLNGQPKKVMQPLKAFRFDLMPDGTPIAKLDVLSVDKIVDEIENKK